MENEIKIGEDVNQFMRDNYKRLHEKQGHGFGKATTAWALSFYFIRKDGSLYKDVVPVLVTDASLLQRLAPHLDDILISNFELNNEDGCKNYSMGTELFYKH